MDGEAEPRKEGWERGQPGGLWGQSWGGEARGLGSPNSSLVGGAGEGAPRAHPEGQHLNLLLDPLHVPAQLGPQELRLLPSGKLGPAHHTLK